MKQRQIDLFFKILNAELEKKAEVILIGASAGSLMGHVRPSADIDFEVRLKSSRSAKVKANLASAIGKAAAVAGVAVNYSENVGGWSRINYLDYRKTALFYKTFGKIRVKIIAPSYWTIGKMARFLELDIQDMVKIIRSKKIPLKVLIRVWAKALRSSDLSLELGQFRDHVFYFLKRHGVRLWGKSFDFDRSRKSFMKQAGLKD